MNVEKDHTHGESFNPVFCGVDLAAVFSPVLIFEISKLFFNNCVQLGYYRLGEL